MTTPNSTMKSQGYEILFNHEALTISYQHNYYEVSCGTFKFKESPSGLELIDDASIELVPNYLRFALRELGICI